MSNSIRRFMVQLLMLDNTDPTPTEILNAKQSIVNNLNEKYYLTETVNSIDWTNKQYLEKSLYSLLNNSWDNLDNYVNQRNTNTNDSKIIEISASLAPESPKGRGETWDISLYINTKNESFYNDSIIDNIVKRIRYRSLRMSAGDILDYQLYQPDLINIALQNGLNPTRHLQFWGQSISTFDKVELRYKLANIEYFGF